MMCTPVSGDYVPVPGDDDRPDVPLPADVGVEDDSLDDERDSLDNERGREQPFPYHDDAGGEA